MKEFNLFDEMLKESISFDGGYYVLAAEGDDSKFHYEDRWWRGGEDTFNRSILKKN